MSQADRSKLARAGEHTPTERERRSNMARLARDAIRQAVKARITELPDTEELPTTTLHEEIYRVALLELVRLGHEATFDGDKIKALEVVGKFRFEEMRLMAELRGELHSEDRATKVVVVNATDIQRLGEMQRKAGAK